MSSMGENKVVSEKATSKKLEKSAETDKKAQAQREVENFKRKYFDYYDDIKISVREDWWGLKALKIKI